MSLAGRIAALSAAHTKQRSQIMYRGKVEAERQAREARDARHGAADQVEPCDGGPGERQPLPEADHHQNWLQWMQVAWPAPWTAVWLLVAHGAAESEARHEVAMLLDQARLFATTWWEAGPEWTRDALGVGNVHDAAADAVIEWVARTWGGDTAAHPLATDQTRNWHHLLPEYKEPEHVESCDMCWTTVELWRQLREPERFGPTFGDPRRARFVKTSDDA